MTTDNNQTLYVEYHAATDGFWVMRQSGTMSERIAGPYDDAKEAQFGMSELPLQVAVLQAENERLRKDAERYRWLRKFDVDSYRAVGKLEKLDADIDYGISKDQIQADIEQCNKDF